MTFSTDLREHFHMLSSHYPGFEEVLVQAMFGLVAEEHLLWYSKPGRAKSMVARSIFEMFDGATVFTKQLTKDMMPDAVIGNVIPKELIESGREIFNLDGGIVACNFGYLDEFFDASDYLLRALLNVLNEREFHSKDMGTIKAPLHTVVCTTNYMRLREATEAVVDRLMCRAVLPGISDVTDCMRAGQTYIDYAGKRPPLPKLRYEDLESLTQKVQSPGDITISPGMRLLHVMLVREFQQRRINEATKRWHEANPDVAEEPSEDELQVPDISPRTLVKLHDMSRAAAVLNDRSKVVPADNRALGYGIYVVGDQSGDDILWHTLCDEWLDMSKKVTHSLEELGELADAIGDIKAEHSEVSSAQMMIGGELYERTALGVRELIDKITGTNHPVLEHAKDELGRELDDFDASLTHGRFDLLKGWQ